MAKVIVKILEKTFMHDGVEVTKGAIYDPKNKTHVALEEHFVENMVDDTAVANAAGTGEGAGSDDQKSKATLIEEILKMLADAGTPATEEEIKKYQGMKKADLEVEHKELLG